MGSFPTYEKRKNRGYEVGRVVPNPMNCVGCYTHLEKGYKAKKIKKPGKTKEKSNKKNIKATHPEAKHLGHNTIIPILY